jgi:hypothetical protein
MHSNLPVQLTGFVGREREIAQPAIADDEKDTHETDAL